MKKILVLTLALVLVLSACGPTQDKVEPEQTESAVLRIAKSVDPDGLDPQRSVAESTFDITSVIYDTLLEVDEEGNLGPGIAESYELSEDGLSLKFVIKKDLRFHNDRVLNAQAVKESFERLLEEESPRAKDYANIKDIKVLGDHEIEFHLEAQDVEILTLFAYPWAAIVDAGAENLRSKPVGSGAYKLREWIPQQHVLLDAFDGSYRDAKIAEVKMLIIPDTSAQIASLRKGDLDFIEIPAENIKDVDESAFTIWRFPRNGIQLMAMNQENPFLAKREVREAINHAVNFEEIQKAVWNGVGIPIGSHFPAGSKDHVELAGKYPYDPEKSKELLKEADLEGKINLKMMLPKSYPEYVAAGQIIANQLQNVGITVDQQIIEWASWLSDVYTDHKYDLTIIGHTGRLEPYALLAKYLSDGSENYFNYKNPEFDELMERVKQEQDSAERSEIYKRIQNILAEDIPAVYLQTPERIFVFAKKVKGYKNLPITVTPLRDMYFE